MINERQMDDAHRSRHRRHTLQVREIELIEESGEVIEANRGRARSRGDEATKAVARRPGN